MKRMASAEDSSAANRAASPSPPSQGGRTSMVRSGRAISELSRPGPDARMAIPRIAGTNANTARAAAFPSAARPAPRAVRAPNVFWMRPGDTMNDGTNTTTSPRMPAIPIPVRLPYCAADSGPRRAAEPAQPPACRPGVRNRQQKPTTSVASCSRFTQAEAISPPPLK